MTDFISYLKITKVKFALQPAMKAQKGSTNITLLPL